jgi:PncC family amidohydrolase
MDCLEQHVVTVFKARGWTLATAESCTGGLISERVTSVPGSSAVFLGGVVSYANAVKRDLLDVPQEILECVGAVSHECAEAMAAGARRLLRADVAVSVTGIAGPDGGSAQKPVGLVYFVWRMKKACGRRKSCLKADRDAIRRQAADRALMLVLEAGKAP